MHISFHAVLVIFHAPPSCQKNACDKLMFFLITFVLLNAIFSITIKRTFITVNNKTLYIVLHFFVILYLRIAFNTLANSHDIKIASIPYIELKIFFRMIKKYPYSYIAWHIQPIAHPYASATMPIFGTNIHTMIALTLIWRTVEISEICILPTPLANPWMELTIHANTKIHDLTARYEIPMEIISVDPSGVRSTMSGRLRSITKVNMIGK